MPWVGLFRLQLDFRIEVSSKSNKNGVEMPFECDFSPFRIQTLSRSHPCVPSVEFVYLVFTLMPGGIPVGSLGLLLCSLPVKCYYFPLLILHSTPCMLADGGQLKTSLLLGHVVEVMKGEFTCAAYGTDYSSVLLKNILSVHRHWVEISSKTWHGMTKALP